MQFTATIKKINPWKNGKGEFVSFVEQPGTFWKWGTSCFFPGYKMQCVCIEQKLSENDMSDSHLLTEFIWLDDPKHLHLEFSKQISVLPSVAKSIGGMVQGGSEKLPEYTHKIDYDAALLKQAQAIRELQSALGISQSKIDALEIKISHVEVLARNGGQI